MILSLRLQTAIDAARAGAKAALLYFNSTSPLDIEFKSDLSVVTKADLESQSEIKAYILEKLGDQVFIMEEDQSSQQAKEDTWIIDPIDGTKEFSRGLDSWAILVAYAAGQEITCGVAYFPVSEKMFYAERGFGAYLNGEKISVSAVSDKKKAFSSFSPIAYADEFERGRLLSLATSFGSSMRSTVASYAGANIACGKMDFYLGMKHNRIWDNAPFAVIIPEAGGRVTDWKGDPLDISNYDSPVVMSNGILHEEVVKILNP